MKNKEEQTAPKLRFKGYTDAWQQRKFNDLLTDIKRGPFGSALKKEFFISHSPYTVYEQSNAINNTWKTRYFISQEKFKELKKFQLVPGDFILSGAGTIGKIAQVPSGISKGVFNQALIRIKINQEETDDKFFLIWMQSEKMQRKLTQSNPGSAMTNLVPMNEIKNWTIRVPDKPEQKQLGIFIKKLEFLITLLQRKVEKYRALKKSLLKNLFPEDNKTIPNLRFKNFTEIWQQRRIKDITKLEDNKRVPVKASLRKKGDTPYYGANGIQDYVAGFTHTGEHILIAEDGANSITNYPIYYISHPSWINNHAHVLTAIRHSNNLYLSYALKKINYSKYLVGSGRYKLNSEILQRISIVIPTENEQIKIAHLFSKLDKTITILQRRINNLTNLKQFLLQNMFI